MNQDSMKPLRTAGVVLLAIGSLFLIAQTVLAVKSWKVTDDKANSPEISVAGEGKAFAVPDVATFNYSVMEEGKTVKEAQDKATAKTNQALDVVKKAGVEDKDVKTVDYSVNPKLEYQTKICPQGTYCPGGKQVQVGFQVSQTIEVKVRDTTKAGDILTSIGTIGVQNVSGLNFTVDDETKVQQDARAKAIADAKAKAEQLARDLGVRLVRIKTFEEYSSGGPVYYSGAASRNQTLDEKQTAAPGLPTGETKVTSNVTITYEIR